MKFIRKKKENPGNAFSSPSVIEKTAKISILRSFVARFNALKNVLECSDGKRKGQGSWSPPLHSVLVSGKKGMLLSM